MVSGWRRILEPRVSAWFGVIAPIWALASIGTSIALSPWFSWTDNALSDLGVSGVAPIFNSGLIVGGTLAFLFIVGLARMERANRLGLLGSVVLMVSTLSLIGIGVFSEAFRPIHFYLAVALFVSLIIASIILSIRFALNVATRRLSIFTLLVGIISFISWVGWFFIRLKGIAIPETISACMAFSLLIVLSIRMYRENAKSHKKYEGAVRA
ncbi:MAG: DUF998 domain-containing protein [archaeon]|nr:DUF998 domain-containing protein [archaeon]MCP8306707.1 DUF998 domain-containing protein [archaeon]